MEFLEGVRDAQGLPPPESDSDFEEGGELSPPVEAASPPGAAGLALQPADSQPVVAGVVAETPSGSGLGAGLGSGSGSVQEQEQPEQEQPVLELTQDSGSGSGSDGAGDGAAFGVSHRSAPGLNANAACLSRPTQRT